MPDNIPMPEVLPKAPQMEVPQTKIGPIQGNPYAPRRTNLEAVESALAGEPRKIDKIKALMRELLHREMRDLVKEIYEAHAKIQKPETTSRSPAISATELADTLDKFAFGD